MVDLESLRAEWHRASEKDKPHDAVKVLVQLERLEPNEPRWSQRLGEAYRRLNQTTEAVDAFIRAYQRYFDRGFLPRAIAMAKLVKQLDAARGDLLEKSMPPGGVPPPLPFGRPVGKPPPLPAATAAPAPTRHAPLANKPIDKPIIKPPPLPAGDQPKPARASAEHVAVKPPPLPLTDQPKPPRAPPPPPPPPPPLDAAVAAATAAIPMSRPVKPIPLARATDAEDDEIRFDDAPDSSIEILLIEFMPSEVITIDVEDNDVSVRESSVVMALSGDGSELTPLTGGDDGPPTRQLDKSAPLSREPSVYDAYAAMASFRLFASLSRDALLAMADAAELVEFVPGAMIIVRDERAFALYAIVSGTARVTVPNSPEIRLVEGDVFGEASLLDEGKRQADVKAESALMTLRIEKRALDEVIKAHPEIEDALFDLLARRLITNLAYTSPLFAAFEPSTRLELAQKFEVRRAEPGTVIAERGRRSDGLYILLTGTVMAEPAPGEGSATRIARGTAFGHASLMGAQTANVTVRASSEAVLLRMPAVGFSSLAAHYPPALAYLAETANDPLPASTRDP